MLPGERSESALDGQAHRCLRLQVEHHEPEGPGAKKPRGRTAGGEEVRDVDDRQGLKVNAPLGEVRRKEDRVAEANPRHKIQRICNYLQPVNSGVSWAGFPPVGISAANPTAAVQSLPEVSLVGLRYGQLWMVAQIFRTAKNLLGIRLPGMVRQLEDTNEEVPVEVT